MKKTLWYISKYFSPKTQSSPGGRGWFLMSEIAKSGCSPVVISSDSNNLVEPINLKNNVQIETVENVQLVWLKTIKYKVAKSPARVLSWLHFEWNLFRLNKSLIPGPDVIVVSSLSLLTILNGLLLKRRYGCRLVFEVRDIWPLSIVEQGGFSRFNPFVLFLGFVEWLGYKKSDAIVGTMPNLSEHVAKILGHEKKVHCIPMGISNEQIDSVSSLEDKYVGKYLSSSKVKVVYAGTIGITNALEVFFEAAVLLKDNCDIEFVVVGDGALRQHYVDKYRHLKNIIFAPKVSKNQVQSVLSKCDIVCFAVFPSEVWKYGQSLNKVIDYMLSGKPIVASYTGYPSMINEAECGSFSPAGNAAALAGELERYSKFSHYERESVGAKGREWLISNRKYEKLASKFSDIV
ncbi:MAG: glycosyltransferase family 4 protein, partial [Proteobacteria bacterium]|nr:glycosyltransferase family 4 protein [Pseudomonadota bacterium]